MRGMHRRSEGLWLGAVVVCGSLSAATLGAQEGGAFAGDRGEAGGAAGTQESQDPAERHLAPGARGDHAGFRAEPGRRV